MSTTSAEFENLNEDDELWLADLETRTINLEHELLDWREARQRTIADQAGGPDDAPRAGARPRRAQQPRRGPTREAAGPPYGGVAGWAHSGADEELAPPRATWRQRPADQRTQTLIHEGRRSAQRRSHGRVRIVAIGAGIGAILVAALVLVAFKPSPQWPPSVATVQSEITTACQNPDVASEPDQVNFACGKTSDQILWVFSLMTSGDNPAFADASSGRQGLEPITAAQGGDVAWSLNLHHPYNPFNPIDSLEVAARAINNIIGGATLMGSNGKLTVQPGLESNPANCARYTGSSALISRAGYPNICAEPVTSTAGKASLVADVYQEWLVGAPPAAAQDASVLFENVNDPGNPTVQAILRTLAIYPQ